MIETTKRLSRRALLTGGVCLAAGMAVAAPQTTLRPVTRPTVTAAVPEVPAGVRPVARKSAVDLIRAAGLEGQVGFVIADQETGEVLEQVNGAQGRPPASVTKTLTALYALEILGPDYRFATRLLATGPVTDGVLKGDLILAGGGDPNLVTDELATLAQRLSDAGVTRVDGDFLVWGNALPGVKEIEPGQLDQLGYNPSLGGLNLNFNRVYFEWARSGAAYSVTLDARSETRRPAVKSARMAVVDRAGPVYTYTEGQGVDNWTVAKGALGKAGSRWLPVRFPALYAGEVFQTLARDAGVTVPAMKLIDTLPAATELARFESQPLVDMMRDMLLYSTNITAEAAGMTATAKRVGTAQDMQTSAMKMAEWYVARAGIHVQLEDHSGLTDENHVSARDEVTFLNAPGVATQLRPLMKSITMLDDKRKAIRDFPGQVRAKTGTLNFVSALAGYLETDRGRTLTFAIFAHDPEARLASLSSLDEQPRGAAGFNGRAKGLQQDLLQRWAILGRIGG
ncbi:D-alanyl-D-alanine carboxypeptidase/D-alanyl-D-alanine endopeptidase [Loktanella sp. M215]|uniref:D-alanyl-D-alanine carboxypeptidase/D-alanyl-D-alanine endopeptidase n=1 Tax=Loktanella sp. M215 TaxID=2675431 RepID=UPI001F023DC8|nr:D-alanyl-D-alanine carboxypeptidase/D-alanyl-D-alanine-endopeptidase [Loktanella sp. M215]MCF7699316.1 D-alanyl-D-alanine carboxypeptidase/D-alanyl-D-alanine-endopeptidase [Loktanella sp. M215]